ncbi:hypothetical protein IC229_13405 [Spirosoma sp. BT702]|uniref:Uncharacterized protein n=1 Tax=Spirosoma profusum TaxID=2771354 RepID=A0A926Y0G7_9BACT|nr:hypothetical protein [Spirosoma profusum]
MIPKHQSDVANNANHTLLIYYMRVTDGTLSKQPLPFVKPVTYVLLLPTF